MTDAITRRSMLNPSGGAALTYNSTTNSGTSGYGMGWGAFEDFRIGQPKQVGNYLFGQTIGTGGFGKVLLGANAQTGEKVAIKVLSKSKIERVEDVERVYRETFILAGMQHRNIIQLIQVLDTPTDILLVMEYAGGGDLARLIEKRHALSEFEAFKYFEQIADAVKYCHKRSIVHRDLKPHNILLSSEGEIKIADFGLSGTLKPDPQRRDDAMGGTPAYLSPEQLATGAVAGCSADMWALGVILFHMLCGFPPFHGETSNGLYNRIQRRIFRIPNFVSPSARRFLERILDVNPATRLVFDNFGDQEWWIEMRQAVQAAQSAAAQPSAMNSSTPETKTHDEATGGDYSNANLPSVEGDDTIGRNNTSAVSQTEIPQMMHVPTLEQINAAREECYRAASPLENSSPASLGLGSNVLAGMGSQLAGGSTTQTGTFGAGGSLTTAVAGSSSSSSSSSSGGISTAATQSGALAGIGPGGLAAALSIGGNSVRNGGGVAARRGLDVASRYTDTWGANAMKSTYSATNMANANLGHRTPTQQGTTNPSASVTPISPTLRSSGASALRSTNTTTTSRVNSSRTPVRSMARASQSEVSSNGSLKPNSGRNRSTLGGSTSGKVSQTSRFR